MTSIRIPACHEARNPHITYCVTGYRAKDLFNLGERACFYFYHFELIVFMNKRSQSPLLRDTFNLPRHLAAYSLTHYTLLLLFAKIDCGQATSAAGSEADASLSRLLSVYSR